MPRSEVVPRDLTAELSDHDVSEDEDGPTWQAPKWASPVSLVISVLGLGAASYLTYEHYTGNKTLACSGNGAINCAKVTTSAESHIAGIPVALLGLLFFVGMTALCLPFAWRRPEPIVRYARLAAATVGVGMILWLIYAELFIIKAICLWCTGVHVLTVLLFAVVATATAFGTQRPDDDYDDLDYDDEDDEAQEPA